MSLIVYENEKFTVKDNGSDEIFIEHKRSGTQIRVSPHYDHIKVTSHDGVITPTSVNGLDAFRVTRKAMKKVDGESTL